MASNIILEAKNISKSFNNGKIPALDDVSLSLKKGEVICLIGPSGGGKTTLLRCLAGLETIDKGKIKLMDKFQLSKKEGDIGQYRKNVSLVFQDYNLWPHKTVLENITMAPLLVQHTDKQEAEKYALELLEKFDLLDKKDSYPEFLSGGQKQRVAIIRALAVKPKVLFLDEVTSALDPLLIDSVLKLIKILAKDGQSMILVTHHLEFATEVADKIIFINKGKIEESGEMQKIIEEKKNPLISDFLKSISSHSEYVKIYRGREEFQAFQIGILKRFPKNSTQYVMGSSGDRWFESMDNYYNQYEKLRFQKRICWKMIMYNESPLDKDVRLRNPELNQYRLLPKNVENPANYYVTGDTVVIQIFGKPSDEPVIIEIQNENVAKSYLNYFNIIWEQSTPIK